MGPPTFSAGVEAIRLDVLVTNGDRVVLGLEASDFEVRDNGVLQDVELVSSENLPLNVILALDTSGSVAGKPLDDLRKEFRNRYLNRYLLSYSPRGVSSDGWHRIEVKIKDRRGAARVRAGYMAGPSHPTGSRQPQYAGAPKDPRGLR